MHAIQWIIDGCNIGAVTNGVNMLVETQTHSTALEVKRLVFWCKADPYYPTHCTRISRITN